jgi:hypothetical protein
MRKATPAEIEILMHRESSQMSPILAALLDSPDEWHQINLNEAPGATLIDQQDALIDEVLRRAPAIIIDEIPGNPSGGFFARFRSK